MLKAALRCLPLLLLAGCQTATIERNLAAAHGRDVEEVIHRIGLPDAERVVAGRKMYIWDRRVQAIVPVVSNSTTTGFVGTTPVTANSAQTSYVPAALYCQIRIVVDADNRIISSDLDGNQGGCARYANLFSRRPVQPLTQSFAAQPQAAVRPNSNNSASIRRPSPDEMSRTSGSGWIRVADLDGDNHSFVHGPTIVRQGGNARSWILNNFLNPEPLDSSGFMQRSNKYLAEFDCSGRRIRVSDTYVFSDWGASGPSRRISVGDQWQAVPPGSITEGSMLLACQRGTQARSPTGVASRSP
jgi:hypothetical protein